MALELYQTSKQTRLYREVLPDGSRRGYMVATAGPMNYESVPDSGNFDTPCDLRATRVTNNQLDGYLINQNGFHYAIQTVDPAASTQQPNQQSVQGTVGFGGRQGAHWFRFRLERTGFIHWPTRDITPLGAVADYSNAIQYSETVRNLGGHANVPDDLCGCAAHFAWSGLWTTPGGGDMTVRWSVKAGKLIEKIHINQAARDFIATQIPATPLNETYFGFRFELDVSDIPKVFVNDIQRNWNTDFQDETEVRLTDAQDRLLALLPIDFAYVLNSPATRPIQKRFYRFQGRNYLFIACRLDHLAQLAPGELIFDPQMTPQEAIAATADDCVENVTSGTNDTTPPYASTIFCGAGSSTEYAGGFRFTPNLPQGASLTGGGSEYATLSLYGVAESFYRLAGTPELICAGDDQDNAPAWQDGSTTERPNGSGFTATTASTSFEVTTDPGSNGVFNSGININAIVEEIVGRAGWSANNGMRFRVVRDGAYTSQYIGVADFDDGNTEARMDAYYTVAGGGPSSLTLLGVG